ncbi:proline-rich protein 36-like [Panonychus citri]|uniref:proline-rich protein 36-like n=1 Tax=Panonychus citri TaxID=50023 RepID=UPI0023076EE5|nr:proline-rich protein 36-like [Panonychus citri]
MNNGQFASISVTKPADDKADSSIVLNYFYVVDWEDFVLLNFTLSWESTTSPYCIESIRDFGIFDELDGFDEDRRPFGSFEGFIDNEHGFGGKRERYGRNDDDERPYDRYQSLDGFRSNRHELDDDDEEFNGKDDQYERDEDYQQPQVPLNNIIVVLPQQSASALAPAQGIYWLESNICSLSSSGFEQAPISSDSVPAPKKPSIFEDGPYSVATAHVPSESEEESTTIAPVSSEKPTVSDSAKRPSFSTPTISVPVAIDSVPAPKKPSIFDDGPYSVATAHVPSESEVTSTTPAPVAVVSVQVSSEPSTSTKPASVAPEEEPVAVVSVQVPSDSAPTSTTPAPSSLISSEILPPSSEPKPDRLGPGTRTWTSAHLGPGPGPRHDPLGPGPRPHLGPGPGPRHDPLGPGPRPHLGPGPGPRHDPLGPGPKLGPRP